MIKINLIFDRKAIGRTRVQQEMVLAVVLVFITVGISGFLWYSQNNRMEEIKKNISDSKVKLESLKTVIAKIADKEKKKKRLEDIIKAIGDLKGVQRGPARIFDEINITLPSEIWITSLSESGGQIKIDGYSFSNPGIATFMENIKASRYFLDAELLEIQQTNIEGEKVKKFTLNTTINLSPKDKIMAIRLSKEAGAAGRGGGMAVPGGLYGSGGPVGGMFSQESIDAYGRKLAEDLRSAPRNPFVEGFKHGQSPEGMKVPNMDEAMKRAERLKGESEQKKRQIEENVRRMEEGG
ncbi:MAG: PilN domain-containing protein [Nitrospinae bacterium]|nr:PilN domain-containing protein [Nitrospinota bacterium]MBI5748196.1 PilN domain-containing protein [Nitrospinota bacterium]